MNTKNNIIILLLTDPSVYAVWKWSLKSGRHPSIIFIFIPYFSNKLNENGTLLSQSNTVPFKCFSTYSLQKKAYWTWDNDVTKQMLDREFFNAYLDQSSIYFFMDGLRLKSGLGLTPGKLIFERLVLRGQF